MLSFARRTIALAGAALILATAWGLSAQAADVAGSRDSVVLDYRFPGAVIVDYRQSAWDSYPLIVGAADRDLQARRLDLEGRVTRITYRLPAERTPLEAFRAYQTQLAARRLDTLYQCAVGGCSGLPLNLTAVPQTEALGGNWREQQFLSAARYSADEIAYLSLYVTRDAADGPVPDAVYVQLDVIETPVASGAGTLARRLATDGRVTLYGLYFDFDEATIKPESRPTLDEIAALLTDEPALDLFVDGHTDSIGGERYNLDLSQRRAAAVTAALIGDYGIDPGRLQPRGFGFSVPAAPNDTEAGRALNRRVDLVRR